MIDSEYKIGVIGSGSMGNGIAHVSAQSGFKTILIDVDQAQLDKALATIGSNLDRQIKKNIITANDKESTLLNITTSINLKDCHDMDLIVEAVPEKYDLKASIFKKLDGICKDTTILASNTSSISISNLASQTNRASQVIGMHFMNPVPVMKLVEVINTNHTSSDTTQKIVDLASKMKKVPVQCNDYPGFVSNRILMPMINEAIFCLEQNVAEKEAIDEIMQLGMAHPIGPLKLADLIGLDVCLDIMNVLQSGFDDLKYQPSSLLKEMVDKGLLGKKTGQGFYKY
tara:strand:+ start:65 stop:919 length:855 start_codon:yes stop_codon:yes gene_type:complete